MDHGLRIMQLNLNGLRARQTELRHYLDTNKYDVLCFQETRLYPGVRDICFSGYTCFRRDRPGVIPTGAGGGVAIYVRDELACQKLDLTFDDFETIAVSLSLRNGTKLAVASVYIPPGNALEPVTYQTLLREISHRSVLLCGDFNAYNTAWGSVRSNARGERLLQFIEDDGLCLLNDGTPTFVHGSGTMTCLDLSIATPNVATHCVWQVVLDQTLGSDHRIVDITYKGQVKRGEVSGKPKWIISKADWKSFKLNCLQWNEDDIKSADVDEFANNVTMALMVAANDSIPRTSGKPRACPKPWWSDACDKAVRQRKKALRRIQRHLTPETNKAYREAKENARNVINEARTSHWQTFCESLNDRSQIKEVWSKVKSMNGSGKHTKIPVLTYKGSTAEDDEQKAELMAASFAHVSSNANHSCEFLARKTNFVLDVESNVDIAAANSHPINLPFTLDELKTALLSKRDSAAGEDEVKYSMLKNLPTEASILLLDLFNESWNSGHVPTQWKTSSVIPILKIGKDEAIPESYRPVSLTSTLCKTFETMVNNRLRYYLESNNLLDKNQSGFRKMRSTTDHIVRLQHAMAGTLNRGGYLCAVFVDLAKAFDLVWTEGLLFKLSQIGIVGRMYKWIESFLKDRKIRVTIGKSFSEKYALENGTPQGSVISPTLFNIMVNDIQSSGYLAKSCQLATFADDSTLWCNGRLYSDLSRKMQSNLECFSRWANDWGFKISHAKTVGMLVCRDPDTNRMNLYLDGNPITFVNETKLLGVIFDRKLTWGPHIAYVQKRCQAGLNLMRKVSGNSWGADVVTLMMIYRSLIRSILDYGSQAFMNAKPYLLAKLDAIQYKALRVATGAGAGTKREALLQEVGEVPLYLRRQELSLRFWAKSIHLGDASPVGPAISGTRRHSRHVSFGQSVLDLARKYGLSNLNLVSFSLPRVAPWTVSPPRVDTTLVHRVDKKNDPMLARSTALTHMDEMWADHIRIYTDGSHNPDDGTTGLGIYVPSSSIRISKKLPNNCSVYTSEMIAIRDAISWAADHGGSQYVVLSDSLSSLISIRNDSSSSRSGLVDEIRQQCSLLHNRGTSLELAWIPSHVGITGNEIADILAKDGLLLNQVEEVEYSLSEVKSAISRCINDEWEARLTELDTFRFRLDNRIGSKPVINHPNRTICRLVTRLKLRGDLRDHRFNLRNCVCGEPALAEHLFIHCEQLQESRKPLVDLLKLHKLELNIRNILSPPGKVRSGIYQKVYEFIEELGLL